MIAFLLKLFQRIFPKSPRRTPILTESKTTNPPCLCCTWSYTEDGGTIITTRQRIDPAKARRKEAP